MGILERPSGTASLYESEDNISVLAAASPQVFGRALYLAHEGFVGLDYLAGPAHGVHTDNPHRLTDTVRHEPRGFEGDAQGPVKLVARNAFLAR